VVVLLMQNVETAFRIILKDPNVKAILINILEVSFVVTVLLKELLMHTRTWVMLLSTNHCSLQGTNAAIAKELIQECQFYLLLSFKKQLIKLKQHFLNLNIYIVKSSVYSGFLCLSLK
jgi:succinyl-CoA synthetase beta subunit